MWKLQAPTLYSSLMRCDPDYSYLHNDETKTSSLSYDITIKIQLLKLHYRKY